VLIHILLNGKYGFHRDELDIIMNARQLDWGYLAYPPVTPFIARIGLTLFGNSLTGLRFFSATAQGVVMFLAGMMARDMGGKRTAQLAAAIAAYIAPAALMSGTLIQYMAFDYLWWVVVAFFFTRLLATEDPRYWLGISAGIGLGMMTKFTMAFWVAGLVAAVFLSPARKHLFTKWLWLGVGLALLIYLPNLIWQIQHNFISLDFLKAIHARDLRWGRGEDFLPEQIISSTNPLMFPLWSAGLIAYMFAPSLRRFRAIAVMFLVTFSIFFLSKGRSYYVSPAYVMLYSTGSTWIVNWLGSRSARLYRTATSFLYAILVIGAAAAILIVKPVALVNSPLWKITSDLNPEVVEMIGWKDLAEKVSDIYQSIPVEEQPHTAILAGNYGEAGALDLYKKEYGLPPIISGADNFWYRGYGDPVPETVIVVGFEWDYAVKFFVSCKRSGTVSNSYGVINEESSRHNGLYICRQPRRPWSEMWKDMLWFQ